MQRIKGVQTQPFQLHRAARDGGLYADVAMGMVGQQMNPLTPFWVWRLGDLIVKDGAAQPFPLSRFAASQNQQDGFRFQANMLLRLIIKRPVQATVSR